MSRQLVLVLTAAAVLAACGEKPAPPVRVTFSYTALGKMPPGPGGALGSGCLSDAGGLPDGAWFGFARAWDAHGLDFDAACFYTGEPAAREAAARGDESPPPNDFYIVNDGTGMRRIAVTPEATAFRVSNQPDGPVAMGRTTYGDLVANPGTYMKCPGEWCAVWVFVNGGAVSEVAMQYLP